MKKIILWDFDGTLSYPNKSFFSALHTAIAECGYDLEQSLTINFLNKTYSWKNPDVLYPLKTREEWWNSLYDKIKSFCKDSNINETDVKKICTRFREILIDVKNYSLYTDTIEILKSCINLGYKNYIATNNYPEIVENLEKLGVMPYFEDCIVSSHIGYEKPRKEFYEYAKQISGGYDVAYMIGDNPVADIKGGHDAGLITIAVHECKDSDADYYCENLTDLLNIIK